MVDIATRQLQLVPLSHAQVDANFIALRDAVDAQQTSFTNLAQPAGAASIGVVGGGSVQDALNDLPVNLTSGANPLTVTAGWDTVPSLQSNSASLTPILNAQAQALLNRMDILAFGVQNVCNPKFAGGAKGGGVIDDTAAIRAAIASVPEGNPCFIQFPPCAGGYKMGLVPFTSDTLIELNGNTLYSPDGGTGFQTATWVGGVLTSNIGTPAESTLIRNARIRGGKMVGYMKAFDLQDFIWNSAINDIEFINGGYSIHGQRCFYSNFDNNNTNGLLAGFTGPAYYFDGVNNLLGLRGLTIGGSATRQLGMQFSGTAYDCNISIQSCSFENVVDGVRFDGPINSLTIGGNTYFENITGTAIDLSNTGNNHYGVDIGVCWFKSVAKAVVGRNCWGGVFRASNRLDPDAPPIVDFNDAYAGSMVVEIPSELFFGNTNAAPTIPSNYLLGTSCEIRVKRNVTNGAGNVAFVDQYTPGPIPFHYTGSGGTADSDVIPFCLVTKPGTAGSVVVDTYIPYWSNDGVFVNFKVTDNDGVWPVTGIVASQSFNNFNPAGKTVTISNNGGNIRISVGVFNSPTSTYVVGGIVRHV